MMYYRRKVILSLFQIFNRSLRQTQFQKLLFLFTRQQKKPAFDFVPYRYGCYSFQASYDLGGLINSGHIAGRESLSLNTEEDFISQLEPEDKFQLIRIKEKFIGFSINELIRYVYANYPYYAINSELADSHGSSDLINQHKPSEKSKQVFTIGYEGVTIEKYLNELIKNNIQLLVDVRNNPVSMKNGFSKNQLKQNLEKLNIEYLHLPALGIPSRLRKEYLTAKKKDYEGLFSIYKMDLLPENQADIDQLKRSITTYRRIALTCFEHDPDFCHRKIIAKKIEKKPIHIMYDQEKDSDYSPNLPHAF